MLEATGLDHIEQNMARTALLQPKQALLSGFGLQGSDPGPVQTPHLRRKDACHTRLV